jgi:cysteine desulfurase/selenocysteine lyase
MTDGSSDGALDPELLRALMGQLERTPAAVEAVPSPELLPAPASPPGFEIAQPPLPRADLPGYERLLSLVGGLSAPEDEEALRSVVGEALGATLPEWQAGDAAYYFAPAAEAAAAVDTPFLPEGFDVERVRRDFPILGETVHGQPLVWLDNAATTQKPQSVIDRLAAYYAHENSNVHRAAHTLAARATEGYEGARETVRRFLGAGSADEIVFTHGTTEAINLVAQTWGRTHLVPGEEVVLTTLEHHSNIVPWQFVAEETGAVLRVAPISDRGEILLDDYTRLLGPRTKIVAVSHVSNALGTVVPVAEMAELAHRVGARVVVDGAQAVAHFPVDVQTLGADFYAFSGHKLFGPTGIGVLYGKKELLDEMPPWQGGGSMIDTVSFERTTYAAVPQKFEAGTPIIAGAIGLAAAIDYLDRIGLENVARHERALTAYGTEALADVPGLRQIGTAPEKVGVLSFVIDGVPVVDVGRYLDRHGIAVRAGHHCAQPTMQRYGVDGTVRPSLALYNTFAELDALVEVLRRAQIGLR